MRGDYSRLTFRPERHYSGVRFQQGRVQLDADFNEQVDIESYRDRMTALDVIGHSGAPQEGGGFAVSTVLNLRSVAFATSKEVWAVGEDGALLRSTDGAGTWTLQAPPAGSASALESIVFTSASDAWVVGRRGTILALSGGAWSSHGGAPLPLADLHGVAFADAQHGWAVGDAGTILFGNGTTWTQQHVQGLSANLRAAHFVSATHGWIVGDGGTILVTQNGGTAWTAQTSGVGVVLRAIDFADENNGWVVGDDATILTTTDGGATWTQAPAPQGTIAHLRAVRSVDATNVIAVGDAGTTLISGDRGQTWSPPAHPPVKADLRGLAVSEGSVVGVGDGAAVLWAVDGWGLRQSRLPTSGRTLSFSAGDLYVEGMRVVNEQPTTFTSQPDFPLDPLPGVEQFPPADGTYGIYLRVRELHVTALERDELREVALGGPDTATRTKTIWQARLKPLASNATCADFSAGETPSSGLLRARAQPGQPQTSECMVPAGGGYRRLENQLYRVEVHDVDPTNDPSNPVFKWSRDNGSVAAKLEAVVTAAPDINGDVMGSATVSSPGRDDVLGFAPKQILELTDEGRILRGDPGELVEITGVRGNILDFKSFSKRQLKLDDFPHGPTARRWDGRVQLEPGKFIELEEGVQVEFGDGPFQNGDWWTIPARTLTASVEWPVNGDGPDFRPPDGVASYFAPLAVADVSGGAWSNVRDCRRLFPPLTGLVRLYYVGGDGQEVMPDTPLAIEPRKQLARNLEVGVANGRMPVVGATVTFSVLAASGQGKVQLDGGAQEDSVDAITDENGVASCSWWLDGLNESQQVEARLVDPLDQSPPAAVRFNASLSIASEVAFDPKGCGALASDKTVQAAIERVTNLTSIYALGQTDLSSPPASPTTSKRLEVLVASRCGAVAGAVVQFEITQGGGTLVTTSVTPTDANGVATCDWELDPVTPTQLVEATLTQLPDDPAIARISEPSRVQFAASPFTAAGIAFDPRGCTILAEDTTVQAALSHLARLTSLYRLRMRGGGGEGLKRELQVIAANSCGPVNGAKVEFVVAQGKGTLNGAGQKVVIDTQDGVAGCEWSLDQGTPVQEVDALLVEVPNELGPAAIRPPTLVQFTETLGRGQAPPTSPAARLRIFNTALQIPAAQGVPIPFGAGSDEFDTDGMHDAANAPQLLTAKRAGTYLVIGELSWQPNPTGYRSLEIHKGGATIGKVLGPPLPPPAFTMQQASAITRMGSGESVFLTALQGSGAGLTVDSASFSIAWLGP